jgi:uncharacterized protein YuzE
MTPLRVTYDEEANAAYIYLQPDGNSVRVAKMYACDPIDVDGMINLDFDVHGRLVGVEVLAARSKLATSHRAGRRSAHPPRPAATGPRAAAARSRRRHNGRVAGPGVGSAVGRG